MDKTVIQRHIEMNLNEIKPVGPQIEGYIRFASTGDGEEMKQLDHFEILARSHEVAASGAKLKYSPMHETVLAKDENNAAGSIKVIPIRLISNQVENNLSARYEAYDNDIGRMVCSGDGCKATRKNLVTGDATECQCPGPDSCDYANNGTVNCRLGVRLKLQIDGQEDQFAVYEFQSGSINTYRALSAKLQMMHAAFRGKLRGLPLQLTIWEKSSVVSGYESFYCADIKLQSGQDLDAVSEAVENKKEKIDVAAMDNAWAKMRTGAEQLLDDNTIIITRTPREIKATRSGHMRSASTGATTGEDSIQTIVAQARAQAGADVKVPPNEIASTLTATTPPVATPGPGPGPATIQPPQPALAGAEELPPTAI